MATVGRNPARIIPAWRGFVDAHPGQTVRGVGEPLDAERFPAARDECHIHESLLNVALIDAPLWLLCPYDLGALSDADIAVALGNHPHVAHDDDARVAATATRLRLVRRALAATESSRPPRSASSVRPCRASECSSTKVRPGSVSPRPAVTTWCSRRARSQRTACCTVAARACCVRGKTENGTWSRSSTAAGSTNRSSVGCDRCRASPVVTACGSPTS